MSAKTVKNHKPFSRFITVSNRLPLVLMQDEGGRWSVKAGSGGLVTAMAPVLKDRGGVWVGWPGTTQEQGVDIVGMMAGAAKDSGYTLRPVMITEKEKHDFYYGFSNEIIWPLFHDLTSLCNFNPDYWRAYQSVNNKFARVIERSTGRGDYIWVNDYHLIGVAKELREMGVKNNVGFFLHIPFPPADIFLKLPWRFQILISLLDYDLIGFQTIRDMRNFINCLRMLRKDLPVKSSGRISTIKTPGREVRVGSFPISIDYADFARSAADQAVSDEAWLIHQNLPERQLILGIDRLDYTKGIPHRLNAYRDALRRYPELRRKVTLIQVVVPSRENIPKYFELKSEIERLVGEINGEFTVSGWVPIHYIFRSLTRTELLAYYRTSEIALVTPLKDGMNLVAKEFCACSLEENCVLILSEFAGAAPQLQGGAILVNPYDVEGVADAIYRAYTMGVEEKRARMRKMRRSIQRQDIYWWVDSFLKAGTSLDLGYFPPMRDFVPTMEVD
jgi:alpha,alpha-trehalose-phosphate synthase [UDP-forming]